MLQFVVPQFIGVEDKILGPITVRQFVLILVWAMFGFLAYKLLPVPSFVPFFLLWTVLIGLLAFKKVNGRLFHYFILSIIQTSRLPKLRIWHKELGEYEYHFSPVPAEKQRAPAYVKQPLTASRLTELSLVVDTGGAYTETGDVVTTTPR